MIKLLLIFSWLFSYSGNSQVSKIPLEDQKKLTILFRSLMLDGCLSYVLMGDKPMGHFGYFREQYFESICNPYSRYLFYNYWKIWKKYSKLFDLDNFIFKERYLEGFMDIHFINKKNVLKCVENNIDIFKEILGNNITPKKVLRLIEDSDDIYRSLNNSQTLYGILFGFGKENGEGFENMTKCTYIDNKKEYTEEISRITPFFIHLPKFAVYSSQEEYNKIMNEYKKQREKIAKVYSEGDFLETTLKLLTK